MDVGVTRDALLQPGVLCVPNRVRGRMALQAKRVRACRVQHARIGGPMRAMTGLAALHLDRFVLEDKRSPLVAVALETNLVLSRGCPELALPWGAMGVVAIATLN